MKLHIIIFWCCNVAAHWPLRDKFYSRFDHGNSVLLKFTNPWSKGLRSLNALLFNWNFKAKQWSSFWSSGKRKFIDVNHFLYIRKSFGSKAGGRKCNPLSNYLEIGFFILKVMVGSGCGKRAVQIDTRFGYEYSISDCSCADLEQSGRLTFEVSTRNEISENERIYDKPVYKHCTEISHRNRYLSLRGQFPQVSGNDERRFFKENPCISDWSRL